MTMLAPVAPAAHRGRPAATPAFVLPAWTVAAAASVAVAARLPFLADAPHPDEAGFLLVGAQWHGAGSSLYGNYWVDRPPLLVTIFKLAAGLGGMPALRVIGCLAVVLVVVGCARAARLVAGEQAARWSAVTAAALCVSPLLGGYEVNGELLAAPFVVGGVIAVLRMLLAERSTEAARWAGLAGALAASALLVKQNFADVAVFAAVALVVSILRSEVSRRRSVTLGAGFAGGAAATLGVVALWTVAHGTSLRGVFDAMYPFRVRASETLAAGGGGNASARLDGLVGVSTLSGLTVLVVLVVASAVRRGHRSTSTWALVCVLVFATASVVLGGNFWHHYLIGLVVPVSVAAGVVAVERGGLLRRTVTYTVVVAAVTWAGSFGVSHGSEGATVGHAVAAAARPGDTIVNLYGHADIVETSGLTSPYEHLWSLPAKTLDPGLTELDGVLSGPTAPTWLVTGASLHTWGLRTAATSAIIARDYRQTDTVCGHRIYLHDGVYRVVVAPPPTACPGTFLGATPKESTS